MVEYYHAKANSSNCLFGSKQLLLFVFARQNSNGLWRLVRLGSVRKPRGRVSKQSPFSPCLTNYGPALQTLGQDEPAFWWMSHGYGLSPDHQV